LRAVLIAMAVPAGVVVVVAAVAAAAAAAAAAVVVTAVVVVCGCDGGGDDGGAWQVILRLEALGFDVVVQSSDNVDNDFCTVVQAEDVCLSEGKRAGSEEGDGEVNQPAREPA
jgi:hypothetical protein